MKLKKTLPVVVLTIACLTTIYGFYGKPGKHTSHTTPESSPAATVSSNTLSYKTCEGVDIHDLYSKVILPEMKNIAKEYPLQEIRKEMNGYIALLDTLTVPVLVDVNMHPPFSQPPFFATLAKNKKNGKSEKAIVVTASETLHFWVENECDREILRDMIAQALLHENYHIEHHVGKTPLISALDDETDAWLYSIQHHIKPMLQIGRLTNQNEKFKFWQNVLDAYTSDGREGVKQLIKKYY